jgi:hypothetical protein
MRKPRYRLIQDLPVGDTEDIAFEHNDTILVRTSDGLYDMMLPGSLLCNTLLFEEISEDNAHWKPKEGHDYITKSLRIYPASWVDAGEPVRYETEEDAQKSIDEHEKEWLAYFGIKKGEQEECRR